MRGIAKTMYRVAWTSPREWRLRGSQMLFAVRNWIASNFRRSALPNRGHLRSLGIEAAGFPRWWSSREAAWFIPEASVEALRQRLKAHGDEIWTPTRERANLVLDGKMPIFAHTPVCFEGADRWRKDHILGVVSPLRFHGLIRYLDRNQVGDSKYVWEPNRFGWAQELGVAYLLTRDARYANKFCELARDWFDKNPYPLGINYCSALEVALRAYAWAWALQLFYEPLASQPGLVERLVSGIWTSCRHVEANLSCYFAPNTHLLGEAFSLFACGAAFPEFAEASRWRRLGARILAQEATCQFHHDGMHRELSSGYHLYATDFYVQSVLISRRTGCGLDGIVERTAMRLSTRLAELVPDDLLLPQFNDCDGGRLTWFCANPLDAAPSLFAAAELFEGFTLPKTDRSPCGYSLLMTDIGHNTLGPRPRRGDRPRRLTEDRDESASYDSGIATYRNDQGDYLLFRAGPFGYRDCPHSHDAPLSFVLYLAGQPIVVDSGTGAYTQGLPLRNTFRGEPGKNGLMVGNRGPSIPEGPFTWQRTTEASLLQMERFSAGFRCRGKHRGFSDPPNFHVFVEREIAVFDEGLVAVVDRWDADHAVPVSSALALHPEVEIDAQQQVLCPPAGLEIYFLAALLDGSGGALTPEIRPIPYSPSYGCVTQTQALQFELGRARRGGRVVLFSRMGTIRLGARVGEFHVAHGAEELTILIGSNGLVTHRDVPARVTDALAGHSIHNLRAW